MNHSWIIHESIMTHSWIVHESIMNRSWTNHESFLNRPWIKHEPLMDQSWIDHESTTPPPTSLSPARWSYRYCFAYDCPAPLSVAFLGLAWVSSVLHGLNLSCFALSGPRSCLLTNPYFGFLQFLTFFCDFFGFVGAVAWPWPSQGPNKSKNFTKKS